MSKHTETQMEQNGIGNTNSQSRTRSWFFTHNNPSDGAYKDYLDYFDKAVIQLEEGTQKTQHLQGYGYRKNPIKFETLKNKFPLAHWEVVRNKEAAIKYCQKDEGRVDGPWIKGFKAPINTIKNLRPWQKKILNLCQTDRQIHWYCDQKGGIGKTAFAKWLCINTNTMYVSGKAADCKHGLVEWFKKNEENYNNLRVIFDITRSQEGYVSYQAIEEIKNGIFFSGKYESGMCIFNNPTVIIFSNFLPIMERLSLDRWVVSVWEGDSFKLFHGALNFV